MSSGYKNGWLAKQKVIADYPVIKIEGGFVKEGAPKPVIDFSVIRDLKERFGPHRETPWREMSRIFHKVADERDSCLGQAGSYFNRSWANGQHQYTARCIMGAVLLEIGGQELAAKVVNQRMNQASWPHLVSFGLVPERFMSDKMNSALNVMQAYNDQGNDWSSIAHEFDKYAKVLTKQAA